MQGCLDEENKIYPFLCGEINLGKCACNFLAPGGGGVLGAYMHVVLIDVYVLHRWGTIGAGSVTALEPTHFQMGTAIWDSTGPTFHMAKGCVHPLFLQ
jgi:hypothetical protein